MKLEAIRALYAKKPDEPSAAFGKDVTFTAIEDAEGSAYDALVEALAKHVADPPLESGVHCVLCHREWSPADINASGLCRRCDERREVGEGRARGVAKLKKACVTCGNLAWSPGSVCIRCQAEAKKGPARTHET